MWINIHAGRPQKAGRSRRSCPARTVGRGGRDRPPALRLSDHATTELWQAYLAAKQADPFLSYRQFASSIVLIGLARPAVGQSP
jgi:hypothetical protein